MKSSKKSYHVGYDIDKAYEMLVKTSRQVQSEKDETEQQIAKTTIQHSLEKLLGGKEVIMENSLAHR